jgi:nucleoid DNA-binding protein
MAKKTSSRQETPEAAQTEKPDVLRLKGLVERVAVRSGARPRDLRPAIEAALAEIGAALTAGEALHLPGLGMLRVTRTGEKGVMVIKLRPIEAKEKSDKADAEPLAASEEA